MNNDFILLVIGSDANAYYLCRCYHELTNRKAYVIAQSPMSFIKRSKIVNVKYNASLWDEKIFLEELKEFKNKHSNEKILLVSSNETYTRFISKNKNILNDDFYFNSPNLDIIESFIYKEKFYKSYGKSEISIPNTIYFDVLKDDISKLDMPYPLIVKPSDVISYNHIKFEGKNKIYKLNTYEELKSTISAIKNGGYKGVLIIQEFIPGDDSYLFDAVVYSDSNAKVKLISLAQIGLQEHSKNMVGNAAVLINGYNTYNIDPTNLINQIKSFMERIGYQGFAEFDMKYDKHNNEFKVLEINARQGRCSYYIDTAGFNLIEVMHNDLILKKELKFEYVNKKVLLSFVPKQIVKKYIKNKDFKKECLKLWAERVNPIYYKKDMSFKRMLFLLKKDYQYLKDYKNSYWKE